MATQNLIAIIWVLYLVATGATGISKRPLHIVLIVADDLGWNDVSFHGSQQIPTPNIDSLARRGIILNNYYVSPICTPTRGALMTGRYPIHLGLQHGVIYGSQPYGLPLSEKIMPQWFKELGYATHIVGKWHLGMFAKEYTPTHRGFDSHYGYFQGAEGFFDHTYEANQNDWGLDWRRNGEIIHNETELYSTELFTREAIKLIQQHNNSQCVFAKQKSERVSELRLTSHQQRGHMEMGSWHKVLSKRPEKLGIRRRESPLFLYFAHQAVHRGNYEDPLQAPQYYVRRFPHIKDYRRKLFAGMVAALDDSVGYVEKALKDAGMLDNCVIVFTTDNGGPANGYDYNAANNFPLRGVKATLWEGGMRGTGFVFSPLLKKSKYVSNHMMHVSDWLPTLYTAAGGNASMMRNVDGLDLWKSLSTNQKSPRTEILHNIDPIPSSSAALRVGDYKLLIGDVGMQWSGWYPPWQATYGKPETKLYNKDGKFYIDVPQERLYGFPYKNSKRLLSSDTTGNSVKIHCGKKPFNASTNCNPVVKPCLFNIATDPCEYYNIADDNMIIVNQMLDRLQDYNRTMIAPGNKDEDPAGNPKYHNNTWVPWIKL